jgi:hypothetical protein
MFSLPKDMKRGTKVNTPNGPGVIEHFEIWPPLSSTAILPSFLDYVPEDLREGSYVRAGVKGTRSHLDIAYYDLSTITPIP